MKDNQTSVGYKDQIFTIIDKFNELLQSHNLKLENITDEKDTSGNAIIELQEIECK